MRIHTVADYASFADAVESVYGGFEGQPWWRGQSQDWPLIPHVHRLNRSPEYEANIAIKFEKRARTRYAACPAHGQLASWLFLMQHYRLPTRLLDWTESSLVGLYFAVQMSGEQGDNGVLWALDPFEMNRCEIGVPGICDPGSNDANRLVSAAFTAGAAADETVLALLAEEVDLRMMVQQAGFTIHGSPRPLERHDDADRFLQKIIVKTNAKQSLIGWLKRFGVRERSLFPDLEHLASDLARDRYGWPGKLQM